MNKLSSAFEIRNIIFMVVALTSLVITIDPTGFFVENIGWGIQSFAAGILTYLILFQSRVLP